MSIDLCRSLQHHHIHRLISLLVSTTTHNSWSLCLSQIQHNKHQLTSMSVSTNKTTHQLIPLPVSITTWYTSAELFFCCYHNTTQEEQMLNRSISAILTGLLYCHLPYRINHHEDLSCFMQLYNTINAQVLAFLSPCDLEWTSRSFKLESNCRV